MQLKTCQLILKTDKDVIEDTGKLRGAIAKLDETNTLLHNHFDKDLVIYTYPRVQYRIVNGRAFIFGIDEGVTAIKSIMDDINTLELNRKYTVTEKQLIEKTFDINTTSQEHKYKFITPWLGLNSKNYEKYNQTNDQRERKLLINKILIGNILSMCKGLGIIINHKIHVKTHLNMKNVKYKSVYMQAFTGEFITNFDLPDYIGVGKGVSHGYGCVINIDDKI